MTREQDGGFTLVELLVVIVIIGILSVVVVVAVNGATDDADVAACQADRVNVRNAVERFKAMEGTAAALAALDATGLDALTPEYITDTVTSHEWVAATDTVVGLGACA